MQFNQSVKRGHVIASAAVVALCAITMTLLALPACTTAVHAPSRTTTHAAPNATFNSVGGVVPDTDRIIDALQRETPVPSATATYAGTPPDRAYLSIDGRDASAGIAGNASKFDAIAENPFHDVKSTPQSTFSADVDTATYTILRRWLNEGRVPPPSSVRVEEMINYFNYDYPSPPEGQAVGASMEVSSCPWNAAHRLVRIGVQARRVETGDVPARNLVFLIDVSGSMNKPDKLGLVKDALKLLVDDLRPQDHIALAVYAGASGMVLPATQGNARYMIRTAIDRLRSGGSTNGGEGISLAYRLARQNFDEEGINRVIIATDGDFNVGTTSTAALIELIEKERESGVYLTVLGVGSDNLNDAMMEKLADKGNGNYRYLDSIAEARKALRDEASGTLMTVAKDVKLQVEFNPLAVAGYRLIGYENRALKTEDFKNDKKDAGEMGAGHSVTALYEIVPAGTVIPTSGETDPLKYQEPARLSPAAETGELLTLSVRYKLPDEDTSMELKFPLIDDGTRHWEEASASFQFASAVAAFGMCVRGSELRGEASFELAREIAIASQGTDARGYRAELLALIDRAKQLIR